MSGTERNALPRCTDTGSVTWNRFEGLLTEPDTMDMVSRSKGLAFRASPRRVPSRLSAGPVAVNPRESKKRAIYEATSMTLERSLRCSTDAALRAAACASVPSARSVSVRTVPVAARARGSDPLLPRHRCRRSLAERGPRSEEGRTDQGD